MSLPIPILLLVVPVVSTAAGGLLALRFRRSLTVLMALGAGLLLGAAFLDLLPEAVLIGLDHGMGPANVLGMTLLAFLLFFAIGSALDAMAARPANPARTAGRIAGGWLIFHSLRDGMAIGAAYAASHSAGYAVALGIAAHDLGDGMNTVILTTRGERAGKADYLFLAADALAPMAGGLATAYWFASARSSVLLLAVAAGFFVQMGAGDFLPAVRRSSENRLMLVPAVLVGAGVIYMANWLLGVLR